MNKASTLLVPLALGYLILNGADAHAMRGGKTACFEASDDCPIAFPSSTHLLGAASSCSATKIGPHHFLTAAHCASIMGDKPFLVTIFLLQKPNAPANRAFAVHPQVEWAIFPDYVNGNRDADIAVITTTESTPEIPTAPICVGPASIEDRVFLTGWGLQEPGIPFNGQEMRYAESVIYRNWGGGVFFTPAEGQPLGTFPFPNPPLVSLLPGDSGSGVFKRISDNETCLTGVSVAISTPEMRRLPNATRHLSITDYPNAAVLKWLHEVVGPDLDFRFQTR